MDDLVRWLGEQLDEDERIAKAATPGPWHARDDGVVSDDGVHWPVAYTDARLGSADVVHISEHDPTRLFNEITFKCKLHAWALNSLRREAPDQVEMVIRLIAETYRHRPGYREEWRA
ncbi:DUF6221 family protein [Streptomyces sp. NBC_00623]|uniref:DUF6221 family protein n=1 Tax=Streptomyces sp. NBC_00623 TaxID=2975790 RepID=UPI0030E2F949